MHLSRTGWILQIVSATLIAALAPDTGSFLDQIGSDSLPNALVAVASLVALALAGLSLVASLAIVVAGSSRIVQALTPAMMRRALVVGAVGAMAIGPAHASEIAAPVRHHVVDGLPLPDRPDSSSHAAHPRAPATPADAGTRTTGPGTADVVVRPGDTLWAIAARSLPHDAHAAEIAHATARWHQANRAVIGDDPDHIVPTQHLTPPPGKAHP